MCWGCILILAEDLGWDERGRDCSCLCAETVDRFRKAEAASQDTGEVQSLFSEMHFSGQWPTVGFSNGWFHSACRKVLYVWHRNNLFTRTGIL